METRKDIGKAFKDSLSQYKDSPNDLVWEQIELELKKKKNKNRPFIFWFRYGSVALIIILILLLNKNIISQYQDVNISTEDNINKRNNQPNNSDSNSIKSNSNNNSNENDFEYDITNRKELIDNEENTESYRTIADSNSNNNNNNNERYKKSKNTVKSNSKTNVVSKKTHSENDSLNHKKSLIFDNSIKLNDKKYANNTSDTIQKILNDSINSNELITEKPIKNNLEIDKKDVEIKETETNKWSVYPNASLIYYDGFNKSFENQISLNYGVYLIYSASEKFHLRIGANKLDLQQTYKDTDTTLIQQRVKYLEIPLEFKYTFSNRRIKSEMIAGFSYLIMNEASISSSNNNFATNVSNNSLFAESTLSFNVGLSLQTKIYKNFSFNIEPVFKYHLKPFMNSSEFNPYTISISTGIEYKF